MSLFWRQATWLSKLEKFRVARNLKIFVGHPDLESLTTTLHNWGTFSTFGGISLQSVAPDCPPGQAGFNKKKEKAISISQDAMVL